MAKYIPTGWTMSPEGTAKYQSMIGRVEAIVRKRVKKYNLPALDPEDLIQEGKLAAAYAVDTFKAERGNMDGYISAVVDNALAMVASESLAQRRQPYAHVQQPDGTWNKVPVHCAELSHETAADQQPTADLAIRLRHAITEREFRRQIARARLDDLGLSEDARLLLELRLHPPPELWIMARNLNRGRHRIDGTSMARHLGWARQRLARVAKELKVKMYIELGIVEPASASHPTISVRPRAVFLPVNKVRQEACL